MYAETGLAFRFMQGCSPEVQQFDDLFKSYKLSDETTLGTRNASLVPSQVDRIIVTCTSEDRREKLSRYRNKKSRRNVGRKSSMLAGRLMQTVNRGYEEGLQKQRRCRNEDY